MLLQWIGVERRDEGSEKMFHNNITENSQFSKYYFYRPDADKFTYNQRYV